MTFAGMLATENIGVGNDVGIQSIGGLYFAHTHHFKYV